MYRARLAQRRRSRLLRNAAVYQGDVLLSSDDGWPGPSTLCSGSLRMEGGLRAQVPGSPQRTMRSRKGVRRPVRLPIAERKSTNRRVHKRLAASAISLIVCCALHSAPSTKRIKDSNDTSPELLVSRVRERTNTTRALHRSAAGPPFADGRAAADPSAACLLRHPSCANHGSLTGLAS